MSRVDELLNPFSLTYQRKVLSYAPIGYWPLWDASGSQAMDLSGKGRHGAHVGVTLAQHKKQFICPFYDGLLDYTNIYSTSFRDAFALYNNDTDPVSEGTAMIWAKVADAGVWTDGVARFLFALEVDNNNRIDIQSPAANNMIRFRHRVGAVIGSQDVGGLTTSRWMCLGITWSKSAGVDGEVKYFIDGVQQGTTDTALGVWAGNLAATTTVIGANITTPANVWHGWLAHCVVWGRALSPVAMEDLADP